MEMNDVINSGDQKGVCIRTLKERDEILEALWRQFDVPTDEEERILEPFLIFPRGTAREDVWHWFDERYSKGVAYLLYGGTEDYVETAKKLYGLEKMCIECDSKRCAYNSKGLCRFPMVHEALPSITDEAGCVEYVFR